MRGAYLPHDTGRMSIHVGAYVHQQQYADSKHHGARAATMQPERFEVCRLRSARLCSNCTAGWGRVC
eukprot:200676-Chlamydomonas_euryale.AAC.6